MSKFQIVVVAVFGLSIVAGVAAFSLKNSESRKDEATPIVMWGTLDQNAVSKFLRVAKEKYEAQLNVSYVRKDPASIDNQLVEAIANGKSPDIVIVSSDELIMTQRARILPISYEGFPERQFRDSFIEASEIFLSPLGTVAMPIGIDPMVMYWNRDLFNTSLLTVAPKTWDEFFSLASKLTKKDGKGEIVQSAVALGDVYNIKNSKEVLSTLIIQGGSPIVRYNYRNGAFSGALKEKDTVTGLIPAESAVSFFTEFSNPAKTSYSWNRSMPDALTSFLAGRLAIYFGYASELPVIRNKNPNLNFDIALMPQIKGSNSSVTYGKVYGISLLINSRNPAEAYQAIGLLTSESLSQSWFDNTFIPPVRRSLLASAPASDAYKTVMYKSAVLSRSWLDPNKTATSILFNEMINSVISERAKISGSVTIANTSLDKLLSKMK